MPEFGTIYPLRYGAVSGHFKATWRTALVNSQAANSWIYTLRNTSTSDFIALSSFVVKVLQTGAHTAAIEDSLDLWKLGSFTVDPTTNASVGTSISKSTQYALAAPGAASLSGLTAAGAAAGMTGMTFSAAGLISQLPIWFLAAVPTGAANTLVAQDDLIELADGSHPTLILPGEGVTLLNRVALGAAAAASLYIEVSWTQLVKP